MDTGRRRIKLLAIGWGFCLAWSGGMMGGAAAEALDEDLEPGIASRIEELVSAMTLEEKVGLLSGDPATHLDTLPNERLGIPALAMADGPHGIRLGEATCFPTGVAMGAAWDTGLLEEIGHALGREWRAKGRNVLLGPCINLHRVPFGGRNFESFSEDPYHTGRLAAAYVRGVQGEGVIAAVKHFAANNQEEDRRTLNAVVDERTLREVYLAPFEQAVEAGGAWCVMAAYNKVNGHYACENRHLLTEVLKEEWGFEGFVVSDWLAVHSTVPSALAGLDLEMPCTDYFGEPLLRAVHDGEVSVDVIDDKVRRILRAMMRSGIYDRSNERMAGSVRTASFEQPESSRGVPLDSPAHRALALRAARQSIVLLKNENGVLPLDHESLNTLAVIGPNGDTARLGGSGSSEVKPSYSVSPLEGILKEMLPDTKVLFEAGCGQDSTADFLIVPSANLSPLHGEGPGLNASYYANDALEGKPTIQRIDPAIDLVWVYDGPAPGMPVDGFAAVWEGYLTPDITGAHRIGVISDDVFSLFLDGELVVENKKGWNRQQVRSASMHLEAHRPYRVRLEYQEMGEFASIKMGWMRPDASSIESAVAAAEKADAAVVCVGLNAFFEGEGHDRTTLALPGEQEALVRAVAAVNPRTIVVMNNGTPFVPNDWMDVPPAIVEAWYPGQEGGRGLAEILLGEVNPSGKMPFTWPKRWEDCPAYGTYPGHDGEVRFTEGVYVGYRHFDKTRIEPRYPFGHGLSYTNFSYSRIQAAPQADGVEVRVHLKNTGKRAGAEIVQCYVQDAEAAIDQPIKALKAFARVVLEPGKSKTVQLSLPRSAFAYYDVQTQAWRVEPGVFRFLVGSSAQDIRQTAELWLE